jgi:hypothetical protein
VISTRKIVEIAGLGLLGLSVYSAIRAIQDAHRARAVRQQMLLELQQIRALLQTQGASK